MMKHPLTRALFTSLVLTLVWASPARAQNPLLELVTDAVQAPIYVTNAGGNDDRLFIVERGGRIRVVSDTGVLLPTPFLDLADSPGVVVDTSGEGGLLSIAFHPKYSNSGNDPNNPPVKWVFVSYTAPGTGGNALTSVIARYDVNPTDPNQLDPLSGKVLLTVGQPATNHNGGQIQFNRLTGYLYIGFGDGGSGGDVMCPAQQPLEELGKMLRIDVDLEVDEAPWYEVPSSNPFYDPVDPNDPNNPGDGILDTIWGAGFRNPWRFSFDRITNDLWIGDVGEQSFEEVDFEFSGGSGGRNYAWSVKEGSRCVISGNPADVGCPVGTPRCDSNNYTEPIFEYPHGNEGAAITGGYVYRGTQAPSFQGRYIFGDSSLGEIYLLADNGLVFDREVLSSGDLVAPVSFGEDSNAELYVADLATDSVYRLRLDLLARDSDYKCISKMNAQDMKFGATVAKELQKCVKNVSRGKIPPLTAAECVDAANSSAVTKGIQALAKVDDKYCQDDAPPFGYAPYPTAALATQITGAAYVDDVFGDLEVSVSTDKAIAKCQTSVQKGMDACQKTRRSEFLSCKKQKIKKDTLLGGDDIVACISADPNGKIAKACAPAQSKLALKTIPKSCVEQGVDLDVAFPGCATADPALLAECIDASGRCRSCQMINGVDALGIDCALECPAP
jgi:glucose/arabinose dehydrogenase